MKTSTTDPLRVDELPLAGGVLGMTLCPGKRDTGMDGTIWNRDLSQDLEVIAAWGASHVVSIMQHDEFELLGVKGLGTEVRARGMVWHHLPVPDQSVPSRERFPLIWSNLTKTLQAELAAGRKVLFHCRGGLGRTGLIAALLLMDLGRSAHEAIAEVRAVRSPRAIETREQEEYVKRYKPYLSHASLLGGAIGDSLGADIEFNDLAQIRSLFPGGVDQLSKNQGPAPGWFTDDTQMTLFTGEGVIQYQALRTLNGHARCAEIVHQALQRWLVTQSGKRASEENPAIGLLGEPRLWYQAAPGMTCLGALESNKWLGSVAGNSSKGCGTIMRVAPIALGLPDELVSECAISTSAVTHGHPVGQLAASAWAQLLAKVAAGHDLAGAAQQIARQMINHTPEAAEVGWIMRSALEATRDGSPETVERLGGGWVAEEALAIALYACLSAEGFEHGLRVAVTHSGDSDSTGAIAGNMLGLLYPDQVFAHVWASQVGGRDIIAKLAVDLPVAQYWTPDTAASQLLEHS